MNKHVEKELSYFNHEVLNIISYNDSESIDNVKCLSNGWKTSISKVLQHNSYLRIDIATTKETISIEETIDILLEEKDQFIVLKDRITKKRLELRIV